MLLADQGAERAVIGCALLSAKALERVTTELDEIDFSNPAHRKAFVAIRALAADGAVVDEVTVGHRLGDGFGWLSEIVQSVPLGEPVDAYIATLKDLAQRRDVVEAAQDAIRDVGNLATPARVVADKAAQRLSDAAASTRAPTRHIGELLRDELFRMEAAASGKIPGGLPTGFPNLDHHLGGGLKPGQMIIIGARPGSGKSALASNIATNVAQNNGRVFMCSLEMDETELMQRTLAADSHVTLTEISSGRFSKFDEAKIHASYNRLRQTQIMVDTRAGVTMLDVRSSARVAKQRMGGLDLVLLDYLQLVTPSSDANRERQVSEMSRQAKVLAKDLRVPIIVLSQLNRDLEKSGRKPVLSDLRESGGIEADADIVFLIHRDQSTNAAEVIIAKNRNGPTTAPDQGIQMTWHGRYLRFVEA